MDLLALWRRCNRFYTERGIIPDSLGCRLPKTAVTSKCQVYGVGKARVFRLFRHRSCKSWHSHCSAAPPGQRRSVPTCSRMENSRTDTDRIHFAVHLRQNKPGDRDSWEFPSLLPGIAASGGNGIVTTPHRNTACLSENEIASTKYGVVENPLESLVCYRLAAPCRDQEFGLELRYIQPLDICHNN